MSDLISRQAAIEEIARRDTTDETIKVYSGREVIEILRSLPSEQPEIIRCKDCKLYGDEKCLMRFDGHDWAEPDGFCHMAERKEQWEK